MLTGGIESVEQQELTMMPQRAASAGESFAVEIVGANYKPAAYVGTQIVNGVNHVFLAEQTLVTASPVRHIFKSRDDRERQ